MHEFPQNRPAVMRKWIKFVHFKRADFDAAPHHAHLCSEHFAECDFSKLYGGITNRICFKAEFVGLSTG